jgi:hypothetical protein
MRLVVIIGPPAVGKMTVGREIAACSSFRLFHNHHTIEPLSEVFGYGSPAFNVLNLEFRRRVIEEAANHGVDLIFTVVWNLDDPEDLAYLEHLVAPVEESGGEVLVLELAADLETRLVRNRGEDRLAAKPSKRDLDWSDRNIRQMDSYRLNTDPDGTTPTPADRFLTTHRHLRLDTSTMSVSETVAAALEWLEQSAAGPS